MLLVHSLGPGPRAVPTSFRFQCKKSPDPRQEGRFGLPDPTVVWKSRKVVAGLPAQAWPWPGLARARAARHATLSTGRCTPGTIRGIPERVRCTLASLLRSDCSSLPVNESGPLRILVNAHAAAYHCAFGEETNREVDEKAKMIQGLAWNVGDSSVRASDPDAAQYVAGRSAPFMPFTCPRVVMECHGIIGPAGGFSVFPGGRAAFRDFPGGVPAGRCTRRTRM